MGDTAVQRSTAHAVQDFCVGEWLVQPSQGVALRGGVPTHLERKTVEVLVCLAQHAGSVVSKEELIHTVWADTFVTDHVLTHAIWQLRQVFGASVRIETIPRRGYRLAENVRLQLDPIRSLAVLPLENLAHDPAQEYFVDGMTEALITELAQIRALRVISRTSSMQYKSVLKPLPQIARELNVDGVVEGSVLRAGERIRISVQLIHAATDQHLWAKSYEGSVRDIVALQGEVARAIAAELRVELTSQEHVSVAARRPVNIEAHEAYLKARYCWNRASEESVKASIAYFEDAIRLDPEYSSAYIGLADVYATMASPIMALIAPDEGAAKIRPAAERALRLEPMLAEGQQLIAWLKHYYEWDWTGAEVAYGQVIALNPNCSLAFAGRGVLLSGLQRHEEAIRDLAHACHLDPLSLLWNTLYGWALLLAGQATAAVEHLRKTLLLDSTFWFAHEVLGLALLYAHKREEAVAASERAVELCGSMTFPLGTLGHVYGVVGRSGDAVRVLHALEETSKRQYLAPTVQAYIYKGLGEVDRAFERLEEAFRVRDTAMIWMKSVWADWSGHARYADLVRKMNFPD